MARVPWLALALLSLLAAAPLRGQAIRVEGDLDHPGATLLREIVARGEYLLLRRDTVLPADFRAPADLVVLDADVRLEGAVEGSVAVLEGGALFVRPGARIGGSIVTVGTGGYYGSGLATTGERLEIPLRATTRVEEADDGVTVTLLAPPGPPFFRLTGALGLGLPTYDRVNGVSLAWGSAFHLAGDTLPTTAFATLTYHSARGALGGALALEHPLRREVWARVEAARRTVTNEGWIRGDLENSLAALGLRSDTRDYHLSDEVSLTVGRRPRQPLIAGEGRVLPRATVRVSRDRSLAAADPWTVFDDDPWRENPAIDEGTLASLTAGAATEWKGTTTAYRGDAAVEWAPAGAGDRSFAQVVATGQWSAQGLWRHRIELFAHTRVNLGADPAPRQRWSFVGGPGTLPALETAELRGDRLVFVESAYSIPIPRAKVPLLGPPSLRLEHAVGSAWVTGSQPPLWQQALGAGLEFSLLKGMLFVDPADDSPRPSFHLSAALPF